MSRLASHLHLPTADLPQQLDSEGYQLNEDGELVFVEVDVEGEEQKVKQKVGPFLNVADSLVLLQSLRQTRALYLSTLLPLFQTRSKVRAQPSPAPAPHTQIPLGRCTLQIGPCSFPDTRIFEVRYTAPEDVAEARREADERARLQAIEAKKQGGQGKSKLPPSNSTPASKPASNANITPELIAAVNAAAATDPSLQNILTLAAGGKATTAQLQFLGGVINSLQKKGGLEKPGGVASPGGKNVASSSSSTPGKVFATGSPSPAAGASNAQGVGAPFRVAAPSVHPAPLRRPLHPPAPGSNPDLPLPSPSSYLPPSTLSSTIAPSESPSPSKSFSHQASPPPNAVASSSQQPTLLGPRPSRLRIPHDIIIEFEENKTDRFLLPLYRCLVSRDPLVAPHLPLAASSHPIDRVDDDDEEATTDPTLLPQSAQSTIRLSFFLPLNQSIVPPTSQASTSNNLNSSVDPSSSTTTTSRPIVRPPRPYIQPSPPSTEETENASIGSGRARAAREKAAKTAWESAELQRVAKEEAALAKWAEEERKRKEERKESKGEERGRRKRKEGEEEAWPTTVVMEKCSEVVWESVKRNWERYLDVGTGNGVGGTEEGVERKRREFEELLDATPPRTYLHHRHLPPLPPALVEASSDKYTLKPYVPNIKSVARVEKDSGDGEKKRVSRKRKVDAASAAEKEDGEVVKEKEKEVVVKPKKVRAKRVKKEEASKQVQPPAPPPPNAALNPASLAQPSSSSSRPQPPHITASSWVDEEPSASGGVRRDEFELDMEPYVFIDNDIDMGDGMVEVEAEREREGKRSRNKPKDWEAAS